MVAGLIVAAQGPSVSFSTTAVLGRSALIVHAVGVLTAAGGLLVLAGAARPSLPLERAGSLLQGSMLAFYALLLAIARQGWAGPLVVSIALAGWVKSAAIRRALTAAERS